MAKHTTRGRRPGRPATRETILTAARQVFAESGYDGTSIRRIASEAGVDPALVHHYFGGKENLFHAAVEPPIDPAATLTTIFSCRADDIPERLVRTFLTVWDNPTTGAAFRATLQRAVTDGQSTRLLRAFFVHQIQGALSQAGLGIPPTELALRATLVASQLLGLALTRYILQLEPLTQADHNTVTNAVAPTLTRYLFGNLTAQASRPL